MPTLAHNSIHHFILSARVCVPASASEFRNDKKKYQHTTASSLSLSRPPPEIKSVNAHGARPHFLSLSLSHPPSAAPLAAAFDPARASNPAAHSCTPARARPEISCVPAQDGSQPTASGVEQAIDAPVSGGDIGARNATLSIMCGGTEAAFQAARPVLDLLGKTVVLQGPAGAGQHTKMVNQLLIAGTMLGMAEALSYAKKAGLNPETVLQSVGGGAAASWSLTNLAPRILKSDFAPGFFIEHFLKDLRIALDEARALGLDLPCATAAERTYRALAEAGYARAGTQAIVHAYGW